MQKYKLFIIIVLIFFCIIPVQANLLMDSDSDGVPDQDEKVFGTDPNKADTDGDGYSDWIELNSGYSPLVAGKSLEESDFDGDGLSDRMELNFNTDIKNSDTDKDGYSDGVEVEHGYDPLSIEKVRLDKRIEINLAKQELSYFLGGVRMGSFIVSSGLNNSTPKGHFKIYNKSPKAWSSYGLWMPYWMAITNTGKYGIHELPYWPSGYREGEDHLGRPASHGCVRLGVGSVEYLYNWTPVGTPVFIY